MSDPISTKTRSNVEQLLARGRLYQALAYFFRHPSFIESQFPEEEKIVEWQEAIETIRLRRRLPRHACPGGQARGGVEEKAKIDKDSMVRLRRDSAPLRTDWVSCPWGSIKSSNESQLKNYLKLLIEELKNTDREGWIRQYEQYFGHTAMGPVPLYELEYGEEESLRGPHQLADISAFYNAFGLRVNKKIYERVDHAGIECEFVQVLLFKEAYALNQKQEENALTCQIACRRFIWEHPGRWLPSFCLRLGRYAKSGLMKRIADFAFAFVSQDCQLLGIPPGPSDIPLRPVQEREEMSCLDCSSKSGCHDYERRK